MLSPVRGINWVVPYIGTWIETLEMSGVSLSDRVVPYIGTWIETGCIFGFRRVKFVVPYIGTWIETKCNIRLISILISRTLYRYVD